MARKKHSKPTQADYQQMREFLKTLEGMPPAARHRLLSGARSNPTLRRMLRTLEREMSRIRKRVCSEPVLKAYEDFGQAPSVKGMARGRGKVRIGDAAGTIPTRRLTPKPAVMSEDRYDLMSTFEALICADPPSITGLQMQQMQMLKGRLERKRIKAKKKAKPKNP